MKTAILALAFAAISLPASAAVLTVDTGWQADNLSDTGIATDNSPWTFTLLSGATFSLTDCCVVGDVWTISGDVNGVSSVFAAPNDIRADGSFFGLSWADATLGHFSTYLGAGSYTLSITGDGAGGLPAGVGVRLDTSVPEPATWAMLITGFGLVGFASRRRRAAFTA